MIDLNLKWLPFDGELELIRFKDYEPPKGDQVALDFSGAYTPPSGDSVAIEFLPGEGGSKGEEQYVFPEGHDSALISGQAWVKQHTRYLVPAAVQSALAFGSHTAHNYLTYTTLSGIDSARYGRLEIKNRNRYFAAGGFSADSYGKPSVINWNKDVYPKGFSLWKYQYQRFGRAYIWNLLQIPKFQGFNASEHGKPFLRGGVKYLYLSGKNQSEYGKPVVINTMADQHGKPKGIDPGPFGRPSLSPRMLYPSGIFEYGFSEPLVQFPPFPVGWESSRTGKPDVDYWTKILPVAGIDPGEHVGYPFVRDRAQRVFVRSALGAGIFGDIKILSMEGFIHVPGEDHFRSSIYAEVRSNRRSIEGDGFNAELFGDTGVRNKTPSLGPIGIEPIPISPASVGYWQRYVRGRGFQNEQYGHPELTQTPSIAPQGLLTSLLGNPTVWPAVRGYELDGFEALEFGGITVWFRVRRIPMESGFRGDRYGEPKIEHSRRVIMGQGALRDSYGKPRVSNSNRSVAPDGIFDDTVSGHLVGGTRFLKVFGFVATRFGDRIIPPRQALYPRGFVSEFGLSLVYNQTTVIPPEGFTISQIPTGQWGVPGVYSSRQYIEMYYDPDSLLNVPDWPVWTLIENRNKVIGAIGKNAQAFGNSSVFNNARVIAFDGVQPPSKPDYYEAGMVAFRIRPLYMDGIEPPYMGRWARIYNDALVIRPDGFAADTHGQSEAETTRRYFRWIGGFLSEQHGTPMVADRIRTIEFERRYSIGPPRIQLHIVDLYTRYVEAIGDDMAPVGLPSLSIHFNKIRTRWSYQELFGWADLRNLTPEVGTRGRASDVFGSGLVRLEWRPVDPDGSDMQRFGLASIADTDRSMSVRGFRAGAIGDKVKVILGKQPPFTDQTLTLDRHGIPFPGAPYGQLPNPSMNQYVLYTQGFRADRFGDAFFQSNALIVDYGIAMRDPYGRPFVGLKNRGITAKSIDAEITCGKPRISPHTIWATTQTPAQAGQNHPESDSFRPVGQTIQYPAGERFGRLRISTYRGDVYPRTAGSQMRLGRPRLQLQLRYMQVTGIRSYRFGWHSLGDGTQELKLFGAKAFMELGKPTVKRPPYTGPQTVRLKGLMAGAFGSDRVEHFHRELVFSGHDSMAMGRKRGGDPYMWQGLRVGPLMPTIPDSFNASGYGEPWVSFRVREFVIDGFNAFRSEYELENFKARMRVRNSYIPTPPDQELLPVGVDVLGVGAPNVALGVHYILPDGNSDQYRKGAPS